MQPGPAEAKYRKITSRPSEIDGISFSAAKVENLIISRILLRILISEHKITIQKTAKISFSRWEEQKLSTFPNFKNLCLEPLFQARYTITYSVIRKLSRMNLFVISQPFWVAPNFVMIKAADKIFSTS